MLTQEFCSFLEYHLSNCFKNANDESIRSFWCDGIALPSDEGDYSLKKINDKREIVLTAYLGPDGQQPYTLLMKFGNKALSRYANGLDLKECIPASEANDWYFVDKINKQIVIQLN